MRALRASAARHPKKLGALAALVLGPALAHLGVGVATRIDPPPIVQTSGEPSASPDDPDLRLLGPAYARHRGKILEVRLAGSPEAMGHQHGRLLYPEMSANEGTLYEQLERFVPAAPLRWLLTDVSRVQFRHVDRGMPEARRREIAAHAAAFQPDPFAGFLPTYHRFVFLQSLYDIALSFERSPLLGCTSFVLGPEATADGHVLLGRNFDFEAGSVFDENKAVFLLREEGRVPYASVAWPGLVGAVTGMNAEGVGLVVHGGRAREPRAEGEPVVHTMREVLGRARSAEEAVGILAEKDPMVSHMVLVADPTGAVAIVERAPGAAQHVRRARGKVPLTNHYEGPFAADPKNRAVEARTSTKARRRRLDELLANLPAGATVQHAVRILRDKQGPGGAERPLGDRGTVDALIATHAVVMDLSGKALWVSEGPHLVGRFLRFDLGALLSPGFAPRRDDPVAEIPADEILGDGRWEAWKKAGSPHAAERGDEGEHR